MRAVDIRRVAALNLVAGEGTNFSTAARRKFVRDAASAPSPGYTPADPDDLETPPPPELLEMRRLQNEHMTEEERNLMSFTRKNVMKLKN